MRIRIIGNDGGYPKITNRQYLSFSGTAAATDLNTLLGIVATSWSANLASHHTASYHLVQIEITDMSSKLGANVGEQLSIAGTAAGTETASGTAAVVRRDESDQYRGGHSRVYLGGRITSDLADENTWTVGFQTGIAAAWQAFVNEIISAAPAALGALKDVIVHQYGPSALPPMSEPGYKITKKSIPLNPPVIHPTTGYTTNPQVASQRRRNAQTG
jgi:hypothetical protein